MKTCRKFGHQYEATEKQCPECKAETSRCWKEANKQQQADYNRSWRENNKEKITEANQRWYTENREYKAEYDYNYHCNRMTNDPLFKLRYNIRNLIRMSLKRQGYSKSTKTASILGCDFKTLQSHLISTAKANYGGKYFPKRPYHIDHIIPVSSATTEAELLALNHYTNLQLLYPIDNIKKGNKIK